MNQFALSKLLSRCLSLPALVACACAILLQGCATSVGSHKPEALQNMDFGAPDTVRICAFAEPSITRSQVEELYEASNEEFARFGISFRIESFRPFERKSFLNEGIMEDILASYPLEEPCDRNVAFIGRNMFDFLYGNLVGAEVLGAVDSATNTHSYIVAEKASFLQLFMSPKDVLVHESYHLFGCPHSQSLESCYSNIQTLKKRHAGNPDGFFPSFSVYSGIADTRAEANLAAEKALKMHLASKSAGPIQ